MAKGSQLRDYQSSILSRLEDAKQKGAEASAGYLGVMIGSKYVLVNLQEISETMPVQEIQTVPLVKPWFLGVANVRGVLYAINDLAQLMDKKVTSISSNTRLLLISDAVMSHVAFVVDKMIGLRKLDEMTLQQNADNSAGANDALICLKPETYLDVENRLWHVMDCHHLVQSKEFSVPYKI